MLITTGVKNDACDCAGLRAYRPIADGQVRVYFIPRKTCAPWQRKYLHGSVHGQKLQFYLKIVTYEAL